MPVLRFSIFIQVIKMPRPIVSDESHRRIKQFAARKEITVQEAYDRIICWFLNEYGVEKKGTILIKT